MLKLILSLGIICFYFIFPSSAYAVEEVSFTLFPLLIGLFGGLALFLFGLEQLSSSLKKVAGNALKNMLSKLTSNRFMGAFTGAVVTGILNSSSVTTVLVVGFITLFCSTQVLASKITPSSASVTEGENVVISIFTSDYEWQVLEGGSALCPGATHQFNMNVFGLTDGSATWGTEASGGDLVYFANGSTLPPPSSTVITWCATWDGTGAAPWDLPLSTQVRTHKDKIFGEGSETAVLVLDDCGECAFPIEITIADSPPPPPVSISASDAAEPDSNGKFVFSVPEPAPAGGIVVFYSVSSSSTATASVDYETLGFRKTISAGRTSAVLPVIVIDDDLVEDRESVTVRIRPDESYELGSSPSATVFISDDDVSAEVSISATDAAEPSANGMFTIILSEPAPDGGLTVNYSVSESSTASASVDYEALGSSVQVPAAGLSVNIPVLVLDDDIAELAETVVIEIQDGEGYKLGSPAMAVVSIVDDDAAGVHVSGGPLTVSEDGTSDQFSVVLTSQPLADVNVSVSSGNTLEATVDKTMLVFTASNWNSAQTVTATGVDDDLDDGDVDFNISLMVASSDINYASMGPIDVAVTNHDNDDPAAASFAQETYPFTEDVGAAEITIERAGAIGEEVSVTLSTDDEASGTTATAGEDYTSVSEVLEWDANDESSRTVKIPIMNDASSEGDETVVLKLEVNGSDLPAAFSELVIQNDFIEDVLDNIDPDKLPPNQQSITKVILTACPTGQGQGGFQELCTELVGEALEGGSVANPENNEDDTLALRQLNSWLYSQQVYDYDLSLVPIGDGLTLLRKN